ncbi:MAG TPA: hypothetical protein VF719_10510, partial [Abditibacteriaceae bacterium]
VERQELNAVTSQIVVTLATSNTRYTPFLYSLSALIEAGNRDGTDAEEWNSTTATDSDAILDVGVQFEGEMKRRQYVITMRDVEGATTEDAPGSRYPAYEDRLGSLLGNGVPALTNGIFKTATLEDMSQATENLTRAAVTKPSTQIQNLLCDGWAILDEIILDEAVLIGDGLHVGGIFRRGLQFAGYRNAEMAGISPTAGKFIKPADFGNGWRLANGPGVSLGDFLRDVVTKHGRGDRYYQNALGIWTRTPRPTEVTTINGHPAHFSSDAARNHPDTYPGRLAMLNTITQIRDSSEMYNWSRVIGGEGPDGLPIVVDWPVQRSFRSTGVIEARNFIGRIKRQIIEDSGARTRSECEDIARSAAFYVSRPGRFHTFTTYFHWELFPGELITADGVLTIVRKIGSASTARDEMGVDAQEI